MAVEQDICNTALENTKLKGDTNMGDTRQRLFVDMDGTLAEFKQIDELEKLYEEDYFRNLEPHKNVVEAIKNIIREYPEIEVNILSAVLMDSQYALQEKNEWLDQYLPEITQDHRVFVPCGSDKKDGIPGGVRSNDFLLDDYTKNLNDWAQSARGIKLLNSINHTRGTWEGDRIRFDRSPERLAASIVAVMQGKERVCDLRDRIDTTTREADILDATLINEIEKDKLVVVDIETTGLNRLEDEILQLSIMDGNGKVLFNEHIKPVHKTSWPDAEIINGISPDMVANKKTLIEHEPEIEKILNEAKLVVGYNSNYFDLPFIEAKGIRIPEHIQTYDVMNHFTPVYGEWDERRGDYRFQKLCVCADYFGYENTAGGKFHDSLEDVKATLFCMDKLMSVEVALLYTENERKLKPTVVEAMKNAGYFYDEMESYDGYLRFDGAGHHMVFESFKEAADWLEDVVFDEPDISDRVEGAMHPSAGKEEKEDKSMATQNNREFTIYQIKKGLKDWQYYAFEPLDRLKGHNRKVEFDNYSKIYTGTLAENESLEDVYARFNVNRPDDFMGHSLSVSDIIVIKDNGQEKAYYCDTWGFAGVPEFLARETPKEWKPAEEKREPSEDLER